MSKFKVGTKWKTIFGVPIEVIVEENMKKGQLHIHFLAIGSNPPRILIRYESECKDLRPLEE